VHSEGVPSRGVPDRRRRLARCDARTAPPLTPHAGTGRIRPAKSAIKLVIAQDSVADDLMAADPEAARQFVLKLEPPPCL
jgi:hypothetical protein